MTRGLELNRKAQKRVHVDPERERVPRYRGKVQDGSKVHDVPGWSLGLLGRERPVTVTRCTMRFYFTKVHRTQARSTTRPRPRLYTFKVV